MLSKVNVLETKPSEIASVEIGLMLTGCTVKATRDEKAINDEKAKVLKAPPFIARCLLLYFCFAAPPRNEKVYI